MVNTFEIKNGIKKCYKISRELGNKISIKLDIGKVDVQILKNGQPIPNKKYTIKSGEQQDLTIDFDANSEYCIEIIGKDSINKPKLTQNKKPPLEEPLEE